MEPGGRAGLGSGITDAEFVEAGAKIVAKVEDVWKKSDMIVKVKEPLPAEYGTLANEFSSDGSRYVGLPPRSAQLRLFTAAPRSNNT